MTNQEGDIKQLSFAMIAQYVWGGMLIGSVAGVAFFMLVAMGVAALLVEGWSCWRDAIVPLGLSVLLAVFPVCVFMTAWNLGKKTRYGFCFAIACLECLLIPFGTIVGIYTIIVLSKASVKAAFGRAAPQNDGDIERRDE